MWTRRLRNAWRALVTPERQTPVPKPSVPIAAAMANADLGEDDVPSDDTDWDERERLCSFAASFNGYEHWGSFERCYEVGRRDAAGHLRDLTLTKLRTALFCAYRDIC